MIRAEIEYRQTLKRIEHSERAFREQEADLKAKGAGRDEIKRLLDPSRAFHAQIKSETKTYERLKRGEFAELRNLAGIGPLLIGARIANGLSQRDLAERLGVHESQVSRDEHNEYHGITVDRANRMLEILGIELTTRARKMPKRTRKTA
jgi:ribosome-binding protein aMBF1 (putative translation factor)